MTGEFSFTLNIFPKCILFQPAINQYGWQLLGIQRVVKPIFQLLDILDIKLDINVKNVYVTHLVCKL